MHLKSLECGQGGRWLRYPVTRKFLGLSIFWQFATLEQRDAISTQLSSYISNETLKTRFEQKSRSSVFEIEIRLKKDILKVLFIVISYFLKHCLLFLKLFLRTGMSRKKPSIRLSIYFTHTKKRRHFPLPLSKLAHAIFFALCLRARVCVCVRVRACIHGRGTVK